MNTTVFPTKRMSVPEFLAWAELQPEGRGYELVDGKVIAMAPERVRHNLAKLAVARALEDAVRAAKLPGTVFTDGVAIRINDYTVREPDASVQRGVEADLDSVLIDAPLIVVEVASPSSERDDTGAKLIDYCSVPSIQHCLVVLPQERVVVHYQRGERDKIDTRIAHDGEIALAPPGITLAVAALLGPVPAGDSEA
jgi:Uma2 family endonuclease